MTYQDILRYSPWLKLVDKYDVSSRLLAETDGDKFVAFNMLHQTYELHSCRSFLLTASSCNATLDTELVNGFIIDDVKANDLNKFMYDIMSDQMHAESRQDKQEHNRWNLEERLKKIQRILGTNL